jgi:hypothetical protein
MLVPRRKGPAAQEGPAAIDNRTDLDSNGFSARITRAAPARVYDCLLDGVHAFRADQAFCTQLTAQVPGAAAMARANADFQTRAVTWLADAGIRQFLDLGCGMPGPHSMPALLELAAPDARCVHVDNDEVAVVTTADAIRAAGREGHTAAICADLRDPDTILAHPTVGRLLDLDKPVGLIATHVLHHLDNRDRPAAVLARFCAATVTGSFLAVSHLTATGQTRAAAIYAEMHAEADIPVTVRPRPEIEHLFSGWEPVTPGLVWAPQWHPGPDAEDVSGPRAARCGLLAAVARHPGPPAGPTTTGVSR